MQVVWFVSSIVLAQAYPSDSPSDLSDFDIGCYDKKDKGKSYKGLVTTTTSGRPCQNWLKNHPHHIKSTIQPQSNNGISNHNYCRNPDGSWEKPWCYTMDPSPDHMTEPCNVPVCPEQARDFGWDAKFLAAKMGEVNVGALSVGRDGLEVKPQFKFGIESEHVAAGIGVGDVRDGLKVGATASAFVDANAEGHNVVELNQNIHCDSEGFQEALEAAKQLIEHQAETALQIAEAIGMDPGHMEQVLVGETNANGDLAKLHVRASVDVGVSAEVRLGWCDTKGYHMVGAGGRAAAGVSGRVSFFAGKHSSGTKVKIILMISNFSFEYTLPVAGFQSDVALLSH